MGMLVVSITISILMGSSQKNILEGAQALLGMENADPTLRAIILRIRLPRALMAALAGSALSLGGLVFQAILRNPLAEPYILGISGGSAVGAIIGILMGFARFPGVCLFAFAGSLSVLGFVLLLSSGPAMLKKDSLLLAGVMLNAFCSAIITFMISITLDSRIHNIIYWLMGDLSKSGFSAAGVLFVLLFPCCLLLFLLSHPMNLLLSGKDAARTMGTRALQVTIVLLVTTTLMVSLTVSYCGLLGFVGLVMPHLLRMVLGPDHRVLIPACIFGGGAYLVLCDLLARIVPQQGEMPTGAVTAMIGAPLFIFLLRRSKT